MNPFLLMELHSAEIQFHIRSALHPEPPPRSAGEAYAAMICEMINRQIGSLDPPVTLDELVG